MLLRANKKTRAISRPLNTRPITLAASVFAYIILLTCVASSGCDQVKLENQSPSLAIMEHDFGLLKAPAAEHWEFEFYNSYKTQITFQNFRAGCRCVAAQIDKAVIEPGGTARVSITYDVAQAPKDDLQVLRIEFRELSPEDWPVIRIKARVRDDLHVSERKLDWNTNETEMLPKTITVQNFSNREWDGIFVQPPNWLNVSEAAVKGTRDATQEWNVHLTPENNLPWGTYKGELTIYPRGPEVSLDPIAVSLTMNLVSKIMHYPERIYLSSATTSVNVDFAVSEPFSDDLQIEIFNPFPNYITISRATKTLTRGFRLTTVLNKTPPERMFGELKLSIPSSSDRDVVVAIEIADY